MSTADATRPSPEALLRRVAREGRGRLKIFLGAAPGVGKTYEMLTSARARQRDGTDVVIAVVETHGRAETQALVEGLEVVPRRIVSYRGQILEEMDLDAVLARRPALALVDELAHTNAPGSRHPKRYMDVAELLEAGIDVFTTLNIQHVESLNDVVAQITRIRVRETVPDSVLDQADDIEVIDLSPADLIQRLADGKVYMPRQAERALRHYFKPGNLTALRELALRRTAQRVDAQLLDHMQENAIPGPWPAGERVLVCLSESPTGDTLVRAAKRLADRLHAPWIALYVETRRSASLSLEERDRITELLRLAERLGAQTMSVPGLRVADEVLRIARGNNVTQIVIGKSARTRLFELLHGSVVRDLLREAGPISIHVMATDEARPSPSTAEAPTSVRPWGLGARPLLAALGLVAGALGVALLVEPALGVENVDLVFLSAVIATGMLFGLPASILASFGATLAYNFFFLPPFYTLTVADPANVAALFFFLAVAALVSNLAARVRWQALAAQRRARTTEALYAFSRKIAGVLTLDDLLWASAHQVASMLGVRVVILLPDAANTLSVAVGYPPEDRIEEADIAAARWTFENDRAAGRGSDTLPGARCLFLPLKTARGVVGVLGVDRAGDGPLLDPDQSRLLDALADQTAVGIERIHLAEAIDAARVAAEGERLRSALLTSLSHDLKTPLAGILGAATALTDYGDLYDAPARRDLAQTIHEEAERMSRFVANLLDMTRIESGATRPDVQLVDLGEVLGSTLARTQRLLAGRPVELDVAEGLPLLPLDPVLLEQVLFNLLDNAARYTPQGAAVRILARVEGPAVVLQVLDEGPGIPEADLGRIFDKFTRGEQGDRKTGGTGLGLAIARGFVEAMGGTIAAGNRADRTGAAFTIRLPLPPAP
ncbi:ATP-binding protein [Zavarzinia sp. CC-PAN008]|uniref:ATP-binding protein n=1 Tax=Zavarzinia sp. CC-PAN008 TaxID=3243332 RepID=UPI003F74680C